MPLGEALWKIKAKICPSRQVVISGRFVPSGRWRRERGEGGRGWGGGRGPCGCPGRPGGLQLPACSAAAEDYESRRARGCARERLHPGPGHCCGRLVAITGQRSACVTCAMDKSRSGAPGSEGQQPRSASAGPAAREREPEGGNRG
ncbi:uncharacterized protein M6G45_011672 [Spheniscus humboldti]